MNVFYSPRAEAWPGTVLQLFGNNDDNANSTAGIPLCSVSPLDPPVIRAKSMPRKDRSSEARQTWDPTHAEDSATHEFIGKYLKLADIALGARAKPGKHRQNPKAGEIGPNPRKKAA